MELLVLDKSFNTVGIIDQYESFNWTDRFNVCGEFELILLVEKELFDFIKTDYYLYFNQSEKKYMIIEGLEIKTDYEKGNRLIVTGRSLESILDRRIIWSKTKFTFANNFQNAVLKMVTNALSPTTYTWGEAAPERRQISSFVVAKINKEPLLTQIKMDSIEYYGENLYEVVSELCQSRNPEMGFEILIGTGNAFVFRLKIGNDRSSSNTDGNQPVIFSPYFENICDTDYYESIKTFKTIGLVVGQEQTNDEGEVVRANVTSVYRGQTLASYKGLYRREVFCDASNVPNSYRDDNNEEHYYPWTSNDPNVSAYRPAIQEEGRKLLSEDSNRTVKTFEGEVDYRTTYIYGEDYFLGDIVEIADAFGHDAQARITEITFSDDEEGFSIVPTFSMIDEEIKGDTSS